MDKSIPVYRKVKDVYVKVGEADEQNFDWLKDELDMKILTVYVDEVEEDYSDFEEEGRVYEFRAGS